MRRSEAERRWRHRRALLLRARGWDYRAIGASLGVTCEWARREVQEGAWLLLGPVYRNRDWQFYNAGRVRLETLQRALWVVRMREFNRAMGRRALAR
jgi:hypothetical protein